ncbi:MAG: zinc metalloprotease [Myxococcota bacterium]|nr:zinc metalloprotease [Myxococcota bacterium]
MYSTPESGALSVRSPEVIDVYFHVITKGPGAKNGNITREQINAQVKVLNDAYQGTGFQFRLADVDRTQNAKWYTAEPGSAAEVRMKRTLRKGDSEALNLYSASPSGGLLGWATFPNDYRGAPKQDGVVLLNSSLPGGSGAPYNEGDTATHEVGHWMGLFHTFDQEKGAGLPKGDLVSDTPAHEVNYGKPPENTDTLPKKPGFDPVHNYMNYTDDAWMSEFTPGQVTRMQEQWQQFRENDQTVA